MAPKSGIQAQIGFAEETTYGTYVAPTNFQPLVSEGLTREPERLESDGIIAGRRVLLSQQWNGGKIKVGGDIGLELYDRGLSLLFKHMFGAVATTGTGPYVHTVTPGDLDGKSLTIQVGKPSLSGVQPFSFLGCKISEWELACKAGEIATLGLTVVGQEAVTSQALVTASYISGQKPVKFNHGSFTLAGSPVPIKSASIKCKNNLADDRLFLGAQTIREPLEKDLREYSWEAEAEFSDLTLYNLLANGTEAAFNLTFTVGSNSVVVQGNARVDGDTPTVGGREIVGQKLSGKFIASGATDDTAIKAIITDNQATP